MARTQLAETHPEAERVQIELLRAMGELGRAKLMRSMTRTVVRMARAAIGREHPTLDERGVKLRFIALCYGEDLAQRVAAALARRDAIGR